MGVRRRNRWTPGPAASLPEAARGGPEYECIPPDPVMAWVPFDAGLREIEGHVIWYTERAVLVEWGFGQAADCAWIWRDAVRPMKVESHPTPK